MIHSKKILYFLLISVLIISSVIAITNFELREPSEFTTFTSTSVNFSTIFNQTNINANLFQIDIYNTSEPEPTRNYTVLFSANITNATFWNTTITFANNKRVWYFFNVTNGSSTRGQVLSDVFIFDVDSSFLTFRFGGFDTINFTLDKGHIAVTGNLSGNAVQVKNTTQDILGTCDVVSAGIIRFNGTAINNRFIG